LQSVRPFFSNISGSSNPALFNQFFTFDFETVRQLAPAAGNNRYLASDVYHRPSSRNNQGRLSAGQRPSIWRCW
jgi:hypothetical protein